MQRGRAAVEDFLNEFRNGGARSPVPGQLGDLFLRRDLSSEKEPEQGFRKGFRAAGRLGKEFLAFRDGLSAEADALV